MSKRFRDEENEEVLEDVTEGVEELEDEELDLDDPVKMSEWVLSILLAAIPIVNIVCLCVWAFGKNAKPSRKTWARAKLVWLLVQVVLLAIVGAFLIGLLASLA
ncbi:MAG: hypothetical protein PUB19_05640 [Lachnospiraceae bacterium]|nr:hypothetical protein [Lachnospiraceae bacterium]